MWKLYNLLLFWIMLTFIAPGKGMNLYVGLGVYCFNFEAWGMNCALPQLSPLLKSEMAMPG